MTSPTTRTEPPPGSGRRQLVRLAASAFVVLAAEPLYLLVDTAVVGHLGVRPLAGLGVAGAVLALSTVVGTFVEYGTTGRAARSFGAGRIRAAVAEGVQASWLAVGIGLVLIGAGEALAGPVTVLLAGGSGPTQHLAETWLRVALLGLPGVLLVLAGNGWMRGVQRTGEPVRIVLAANAASAALSPVLVFPAGMGLTGSAVANVVGQVLGGALFLRALHRSGVSWRPDRAVLRAQATVGRDLIVRAAAFQVAFLCAAGVAARMGSTRIAAHQIGMQLWEFTALLLDSVAIAAQSLVGAALGGADPAAARRWGWQVARWGLVAGALLGACFAAGYAVIPRLFTPSAAVLDQTRLLWPWFVGMLPAAGVVFALDGVLIGAGDVGFLRSLTMIAALGAYTPLTLAAWHWHWGLSGVWAGLTGFVLVRLVGVLARTRGAAWMVLGHRHD